MTLKAYEMYEIMNKFFPTFFLKCKFDAKLSSNARANLNERLVIHTNVVVQ